MAGSAIPASIKPSSTSSRTRRGTPRACGRSCARVVPVRDGHPRARRHGLPEAGHAVGRRAAAVLRRARQDRQLPGGGVERADRGRRTWPLAFDLYLPASWTDDAARRDAAGMPATRAVPREMAHRAGAGARRSARRASRSPASSSMRTTGATPTFRAGLERLGVCPMASRFAARRSFAVPGVRATRLSATALADLRARRRVGDRHVGHGHRGAAHAPLLCAPRPPADGPRRAVVALRTLGDRRPQVLPAPSSGDDAAARPGRARPQPLAHRAAVSRTEGRPRARSLRRPHLSRLDTSRRPHGRRLHVSPDRTRRAAEAPRPRSPSSAGGSARSWACSTSSTTADYCACSTASAGTRHYEGDKVVGHVAARDALTRRRRRVQCRLPGEHKGRCTVVRLSPQSSLTWIVLGARHCRSEHA